MLFHGVDPNPPFRLPIPESRDHLSFLHRLLLLNTRFIIPTFCLFKLYLRRPGDITLASKQ